MIKKVQILTGSDKYWDLTTDEIIKGLEGESGPIAMQSKFGWLIAGPVHKHDQNDHVYFNVTNLIIDGIHDESEMPLNYERVEQDELVNTFGKVWEIEELGIRKFPEKERQPRPMLYIHQNFCVRLSLKKSVMKLDFLGNKSTTNHYLMIFSFP